MEISLKELLAMLKLAETQIVDNQNAIDDVREDNPDDQEIQLYLDREQTELDAEKKQIREIKEIIAKQTQ
jgi:hypothetical protein